MEAATWSQIELSAAAASSEAGTVAPGTRVLGDLNVGSITPCEQHWEGWGMF